MTQNNEFYIAGYETNLDDTGEAAIATGTVALTLDAFVEQREADKAGLEAFIEDQGQVPNAYKLVLVGTVWEV